MSFIAYILADTDRKTIDDFLSETGFEEKKRSEFHLPGGRIYALVFPASEHNRKSWKEAKYFIEYSELSNTNTPSEQYKEVYQKLKSSITSFKFLCLNARDWYISDTKEHLEP